MLDSLGSARDCLGFFCLSCRTADLYGVLLSLNSLHLRLSVSCASSLEDPILSAVLDDCGWLPSDEDGLRKLLEYDLCAGVLLLILYRERKSSSDPRSEPEEEEFFFCSFDC